MNPRVLLAIATLSAAAVACGASSLPDLPTAGPTVVEDISVPAPAADEARLTISFGAGELKLAPGASNLVEGQVSYNLEQLKPEVTVEGAAVELTQSDRFSLIEPRDIENTWDLKLGAVPVDLSINAGAYKGHFELGGLSLTALTVKDGASTVELAFSEPNLSSMSVLRYETGASDVHLAGLGNANFSTMIMNSGAGDYTLDFTGELRQNATITISAGLSNIILVIPEGVPATVTTETALSNTNAGPSWKQDGNRYIQSGSGPTLTFIIQGGLGNLTLTD